MRREGVLTCERAKPPCHKCGFWPQGLCKLANARRNRPILATHRTRETCWPGDVPAATVRYPLQEAPVAKEPTVHKDIVSLSFEDALKELEGIVQQLERGQVKLDEAITAYERGALLKRHCEQKLAEAKMK